MQPLAINFDDLKKLNRHFLIQNSLDFKNSNPKKQTIATFKANLIDKNPKCKAEIKKLSEKQIKTIANILLKYINNYEDLKSLEFLFIQPNITKDGFEKYVNSQSIILDQIPFTLDYIIKILDENNSLKGEEINKKCSEYLYEKRNKLQHRDVFKLLKFCLTGNNTKFTIDELFEILGEEKFKERLRKTQNLLNK